MMRDVERIIATHADFQAGSPGNMGLGHLTRAGVLFLCAAWELYIEEVLSESIKHCIEKSASPEDLPRTVKKTISQYVRESKHQLKPIAMAGDGWKTIYTEIASEWILGLNTPKSHNIDQGFHTLVGIEKLSDNWSLGATVVNRFVEVRGDIAHRGSDAGNVHMSTLKNTYKEQITKCALETDHALSTYIRNAFSPANYPWNRRQI